MSLQLIHIGTYLIGIKLFHQKGKKQFTVFFIHMTS